MLESHPGVGCAAVAELTRGGHTVERCATADRRYPCRGLAGADRCPLDEYVDVAVLAQEPGVDHVEHGAICAARARVPVVEINPAHANVRRPATVWQSAAGSELLGACEMAARDGEAHVRAVSDRLVALGVVRRVELEGTQRTVAVAVQRGTNSLSMTIELANSIADRRGEIVRAATEVLRDFDRGVAVIDIAVREGRAENCDPRFSA